MSGVGVSILDGAHRALGAKMTPFGGWEMPLQYEGVLAEHQACREDAVVFDVSHLGGVRVQGEGALDGLQRLFTNDLTRVEPGRTQYTHLLDESDAHVVDDIIVWWLASDDFLVIPNASNTEPALAAMGEVAPSVEDVTSTRAFLAVQGPTSRERLDKVLPEAAAVARNHVAVVPYEGHELIVGGTGYTGEEGVEIHAPEPVAEPLWQALVEDAGVTPAGLGARDTLRLEKGYPLHGHELGPGITPLQAGLGWVVAWDKGPFRGRDALEAEKERGVARHLVGLRTEGRQVPREGYAVSPGDGVVTSGNFSPTLGCGIALAFVPPEIGTGATVTVDVRGKAVPADVVKPPFV